MLELTATCSESVFWNFVRNHLTRHEQERYYHLQNVTTDYGRGRSWLRSSINEHSLERYLKMLFSDAGIVAEYYETSAFFNRTECRDCLVDSARSNSPFNKLSHNFTPHYFTCNPAQN